MRIALMAVLWFVLIVATGLLYAGCPHDSCTPNETRCFENQAQICNSETDWQPIADCDDLGGEMIDWVCCWQEGEADAGVPAGHTCLPGRTCP